MQVKIRDGLHLPNALGDGVDRNGGEIVEVDQSIGERWIAEGWVGEYEASRSVIG